MGRGYRKPPMGAECRAMEASGRRRRAAATTPANATGDRAQRSHRTTVHTREYGAHAHEGKCHSHLCVSGSYREKTAGGGGGGSDGGDGGGRGDGGEHRGAVGDGGTESAATPSRAPGEMGTTGMAQAEYDDAESESVNAAGEERRDQKRTAVPGAHPRTNDHRGTAPTDPRPAIGKANDPVNEGSGNRDRDGTPRPPQGGQGCPKDRAAADGDEDSG